MSGEFMHSHLVQTASSSRLVAPITPLKSGPPKDGRLLSSLDGHSDVVRSIAFDAQGKRLISGGSDKKVHVWDLASGARLLTLDSFHGDIYSVDFSNDGSRLVTASRDHRLAIWDATTGRLLLDLQEAKWSNINSAHFNPEGTLLITGDTTGYAAIWDVRSGRLLGTYFQGGSTMGNARFSPDSRRALTDMANEIAIWDVKQDTRSSAELSAYVRCRVPFRLEAENLVQTQPEASACSL
jgi:WD40 repeat protein